MICEYFKVSLSCSGRTSFLGASETGAADRLVKQHPEQSWILPAASELLIPQ